MEAGVTGIEPEVWSQLERSRPTGDELLGRQAVPDISPRLLAAVDSRGRRHFLVLLDPEDPQFRDASSRGLKVLTQALVLSGHTNARYIDLACEDPLGHDMFDLIAVEIAQRLHSAEENPAEIVSRVLAKWRRFWGQLPRQMLAREAQIGLFTELWFLAYWLVPAMGPAVGIRMWRGPFGARHDFERPGLSVEAKGTTSTRGRLHIINGLQQLDPPQDGELLFFSLRLREEAGAENTLPLLIQACRQRIAIDPDAEGMFEAALSSAGYLATHEEEYSKVHWRVIEDLLFSTRKGFPRIHPELFESGIPAGVEEIEYTINLGTFENLVVAAKPGDVADVLRPSN